jgi:membrane dipeptidase
MEERGELVQIVDRGGLEQHLRLWLNDPPRNAPIGYILSLEGADSILTPRHLVRAWEQGLRALGPAHYGAGRYAFGTHAARHLEPLGYELLAEMDRLGMILDATHLCDEAFWDALEVYQGPIWASHNNCRALVPDQRQFTDEQIKALIARGAILGAPLDAWMMVPGWARGETTPQSSGVSLSHMIDHVDHICQLAGNARHVGIGTDLDGGYGTEQTARDLDTIADLQKLPPMFAARGFNDEAIRGIMSENWVRFLRGAWK